MRTIAVEEHFATPGVMAAWQAQDAEHRDDATALYQGPLGPSLLDLGAGRVAWMDEMGIDVQVLSLTTPGVHGLEPAVAVELAREANEAIAAAMSGYPGRFGGLATIPTPDPEAGAAELRRAVVELGFDGAMVFGRTRDRNLDHPDNESILAAANELRVPLFVHPQLSTRPVRDALYSGLPNGLSFALSSAGLGWHYEAGVQFARLALSGVLDRYPDLRIVLGHWGDVVIFYLDEIDIIPRIAGVDGRPLSDYVRQHVYVAPSGTFSPRYLGWAIDVVGIDRLLLALDYPFVRRSPGDVASFLESIDLGETDRERLAFRNWEGLVARINR